jgi:hypothetical protein
MNASKTATFAPVTSNWKVARFLRPAGVEHAEQYRGENAKGAVWQELKRLREDELDDPLVHRREIECRRPGIA